MTPDLNYSSATYEMLSFYGLIHDPPISFSIDFKGLFLERLQGLDL